MADSFDLVIIGAGSGGLTAAEFAAKLGVRVALVEKRRIGGDCTWTGCVPSKALLKVAKVAHAARTSAQYGIVTSPPTADMRQVREYVKHAIADVYQFETPEQLARDGVEVVKAAARFLDPHTIQAGERRLTANKFILAMGAHPFVPPIPGLEDVPYFTYEQLFDNDRLPKRLLIIGGGPIGAEMAQAHQRLGARVTVIDRALLPRDEPEVSEVMCQVFVREGIDFIKGLVTCVRKDGDETPLKGVPGIVLSVNDRELHGDMLLVAVGRAPTVEGLDLEKAGVMYSRTGIQVNEHLQTSARHIYAAGDCTGGYQFTHYAGWQAFQAVRNALLPGNSRGITDIVPWTTFTDPEVAHVGLTEAEAREKFGEDVRITRWDMNRVDRAIIENDTDGFIKVVHKKDGTLLGVTIVAERAGEVIAEFVLALQRGLKVGDLAGVIHVYPTYSIAVQQLTSDVALDSFLDSALGKALIRMTRAKTW